MDSFEDRDKLLDDLIRMMEQGSLNDVKIKLSDGEIAANKDILIVRSDYFATMFSNSKFVEGETGLVDMSHCSKAVMEKIIKFIFSGTIKFRDLSLIQLLELSHMSEMMLLNEIKSEVDDFVKLVFLRENCEDVKFLLELISGLKFANKHNLSLLKLWIIMYLYWGLKEIPDDVECSDSFKTLPIDLIVDLFILGGFNLYWKPPTTIERLKVFIVWLSANEETDEQQNDIVATVDFEDFTVEELMTTVRESGLYPAEKIDERVLDLVKKKDTLLNEKDQLLGEKDMKIKEQDLKINELDTTLQNAKKHIPISYWHYLK